MKARLEFDFDNPDANDKLMFKLAVNSYEMCEALDEINSECRSLMKHADLSDEEYRRIEQIRERIPYHLIQWDD